MVSVKVIGLDAVKRQLDELIKKKVEFVNSKVSKTNESISRDTKAGIAGDMTRDYQLYNQMPDDSLRNVYTWANQSGKVANFAVNWDAPTAAYYEFGTGTFAAQNVPSLPQWWQDYAKSFYVNGKGRTPTHNILYPIWIEKTTLLIENLKESIND